VAAVTKLFFPHPVDSGLLVGIELAARQLANLLAAMRASGAKHGENCIKSATAA